MALTAKGSVLWSHVVEEHVGLHLISILCGRVPLLGAAFQDDLPFEDYEPAAVSRMEVLVYK